jgi:transcriptional regulator with XRE-family HTH domain
MESCKSNPMDIEPVRFGFLFVIIDAMNFADRLRYARKRSGLTQEQLAEGCGISNRTVSAWEKGVAEGILAENLFCVADKMGVDARWLATGDGPEPGEYRTTADIERDLRNLSPEKQEAVRTIVKTLK